MWKLTFTDAMTNLRDYESKFEASNSPLKVCQNEVPLKCSQLPGIQLKVVPTMTAIQVYPYTQTHTTKQV